MREQTQKKVIEMAQKRLLMPFDVSPQQLQTVLNKAMGVQIDLADIYLQSVQAESWHLEDGAMKEGGFSIDQGFGLRLVSGEKTGFAYSDEIHREAFTAALASAKSIVHGQTTASLAVSQSALPTPTPRYGMTDPLASWTAAQKAELLQKIDAYARAKDPRVIQVNATLSASFSTSLLLNHWGQVAADLRPLVSLRVHVMVEAGGRREQGTGGGGARTTYVHFAEWSWVQACVDKAVRQALTNLEARPAPAGTFPVVLGPGWPGVLLHEAVGHGLEADFNRKGSSTYSGRLGQRVASPLCTVVDDGTLQNLRGSITVDDEGVPSQRNVLIENGKLCAYLQDRQNAMLMKMPVTGNGRRESYAFAPVPRMTNTFLMPGESDPAEIIASLDKGLYAVDFSGGQVDITSGQFVFSSSEAYWVEGGKIQYPVRGATLIGNGPDVLSRISMVGNDLQLDTGMGSCGKAGQTVPVGVGQPTLKIDALTVGGSRVS